MKAERERDAKKFRGEGQQQAQQIRAQAEKERTIILAEADREAQITRGEGDREAIEIWNKAAGVDPQFYAFYRSLEAYKKSLGQGGTSMVLSPNAEFFDFFAKSLNK